MDVVVIISEACLNLNPHAQVNKSTINSYLMMSVSY